MDPPARGFEELEKAFKGAQFGPSLVRDKFGSLRKSQPVPRSVPTTYAEIPDSEEEEEGKESLESSDQTHLEDASTPPRAPKLARSYSGLPPTPPTLTNSEVAEARETQVTEPASLFVDQLRNALQTRASGLSTPALENRSPPTPDSTPPGTSDHLEAPRPQLSHYSSSHAESFRTATEGDDVESVDVRMKNYVPESESEVEKSASYFASDEKDTTDEAPSSPESVKTLDHRAAFQRLRGVIQPGDSLKFPDNALLYGSNTSWIAARPLKSIKKRKESPKLETESVNAPVTASTKARKVEEDRGTTETVYGEMTQLKDQDKNAVQSPAALPHAGVDEQVDDLVREMSLEPEQPKTQEESTGSLVAPAFPAGDSTQVNELAESARGGPTHSKAGNHDSVADSVKPVSYPRSFLRTNEPSEMVHRVSTPPKSNRDSVSEPVVASPQAHILPQTQSASNPMRDRNTIHKPDKHVVIEPARSSPSAHFSRHSNSSPSPLLRENPSLHKESNDVPGPEHVLRSPEHSADPAKHSLEKVFIQSARAGKTSLNSEKNIVVQSATVLSNLPVKKVRRAKTSPVGRIGIADALPSHLPDPPTSDWAGGLVGTARRGKAPPTAEREIDPSFNQPRESPASHASDQAIVPSRSVRRVKKSHRLEGDITTNLSSGSPLTEHNIGKRTHNRAVSDPGKVAELTRTAQSAHAISSSNEAAQHHPLLRSHRLRSYGNSIDMPLLRRMHGQGSLRDDFHQVSHDIQAQRLSSAPMALESYPANYDTSQLGLQRGGPAGHSLRRISKERRIERLSSPITSSPLSDMQPMSARQPVGVYSPPQRPSQPQQGLAQKPDTSPPAEAPGQLSTASATAPLPLRSSSTRRRIESYSLFPPEYVAPAQRRLSLHAPGTPLSTSQVSDRTDIEVCEAQGIEIFPHNNESLLVVRSGSKREPRSADNDNGVTHRKPTDQSFTNPRRAPTPPPLDPPLIQFHPPTPNIELDKQLGVPTQVEKPGVQRSLSLSKRVRRASASIIPAFVFGRSHSAKHSSLPQQELVERPRHLSSTWQPRDLQEMYDSDDDDDNEFYDDDEALDRLPPGGDMSDLGHDEEQIKRSVSQGGGKWKGFKVGRKGAWGFGRKKT